MKITPLKPSKKYLTALCAGLSLSIIYTNTLAHVTLEVPEAMAASSYKAIFKVGHGCEGANTQAVQVNIPAGVVNVKPMPKAGWTLDTQTAAYPTPTQIYGATVKEGVSQVTWRGGLLLNAHYDEFVLSTFVAGDSAANTYFKVTQLCDGKDAQARLDWDEIPSDSTPKPKRPAVLLKVKPPKSVAPQAHH
jgi:periplasmic copper chaperone A